MKTRDLDEHLRAHEIGVWFETPRHIYYLNRGTGRNTAVPRRATIDNDLARDICYQLEVPLPAGVTKRPSRR
jgi:mRNA interferase HicA